MVARKSDLAWFERSAASRASRSSRLVRVSDAVRAATRCSSSSFSSFSRASAALRSATSSASRRFCIASCWLLGMARTVGMSGQSMIAVVIEIAAVTIFANRLEPVGRNPHRPDAEEMCDAAGHDERGEQHQHPSVDQVLATKRQPHEGDGNREVGAGDHQVRDDVRPEDIRPPKQTHSMRLEAFLRKEIPDPCLHAATRQWPIDCSLVVSSDRANNPKLCHRCWPTGGCAAGPQTSLRTIGSTRFPGIPDCSSARTWGSQGANFSRARRYRPATLATA